LILYRKSAQLRIRRAVAPEPPWWFATAIAPYGPRRAAPVAIDYLDLRASCPERMEVAVTERVAEEIERNAARIAGPVLIDAAEFAEVVFGRGEEALAALGRPALHLISARGTLPRHAHGATVVVAAWPLEFHHLERLAKEARGQSWGMAVPVLFPVTTDLTALGELCDLARANGASFFAAIPIEADPTAKQAIARSLALDDEDETFTMLFHADLEPVHVATERHVAALAHQAGMADFVVPPGWEEKTNWNAAILLTLIASRMMAMAHDVELAGTLARSARLVAELEKPLVQIAAAASLSIVEALDEVSADILGEWLEGRRAAFADRINERWRVRRDYLASGAAPEPSS
jgi:hypothetical protein